MEESRVLRLFVCFIKKRGDFTSHQQKKKKVFFGISYQTDRMSVVSWRRAVAALKPLCACASEEKVYQWNWKLQQIQINFPLIWQKCTGVTGLVTFSC